MSDHLPLRRPSSLVSGGIHPAGSWQSSEAGGMPPASPPHLNAKGPFGRRARSRARWWARHARYPPRPPLLATSRLTVEVTRPRREAMAVKLSPRWSPRLISSRSARLRRPPAGSQASGLAGRIAFPARTTRTPSCEHDTWRATSRSDRPSPLSRRAIRRCSIVKWGAIHNLLGVVNQRH